MAPQNDTETSGNEHTTPEYDATDTYQDAIEVLEQEVHRRTLEEGREACRAARRILLSADGRGDAPPVGGSSLDTGTEQADKED